MQEENIITFNYNTEYAEELRNAVNDRSKFSYERELTVKYNGEQYTYFAWNRICAIMDRLQDTLDYINGIQLGKFRGHRSAFDFYDFINNAYIIIDCVKTIGLIFDIDKNLIKEIERSNEVFGTPLPDIENDDQFFKYVRSICAVHPTCTNNSKQYPFIKNGQLHCCPYVTWKGGFAYFGKSDSDLMACIYTSEKGAEKIHLDLYVDQFKRYLGKWIDLIPKVIEAKNNYTDNQYEILRHKYVKQLSDFGNNIVDYLQYLKEESLKRFDDGRDCYFDGLIRAFTITLSNPNNNKLLQKYQNAVQYSLNFYRNQLQNMSYEGFENTGIPDDLYLDEIDLFGMISNISCFGTSFFEYSYEISKMYCLEPNDHYHYYDRMFARNLLTEPKEQINQYVDFTNEETDEEVIVLVTLALYLDSLQSNTLLNKCIPNEEKYRIRLLSKDEYSDLLSKQNREDCTSEIDIVKIIEEYGI